MFTIEKDSISTNIKIANNEKFQKIISFIPDKTNVNILNNKILLCGYAYLFLPLSGKHMLLCCPLVGWVEIYVYLIIGMSFRTHLNESSSSHSRSRLTC